MPKRSTESTKPAATPKASPAPAPRKRIPRALEWDGVKWAPPRRRPRRAAAPPPGE